MMTNITYPQGTDLIHRINKARAKEFSLGKTPNEIWIGPKEWEIFLKWKEMNCVYDNTGVPESIYGLTIRKSLENGLRLGESVEI